MKTERHNLLELIGRSQNTYHSAILTCYTFDPIFFNSFFMPHFRLNRINNVIVFLDSTNYDRLLNDYPSFGLTSDSIKYTLIRQPSSSTGVYHPKLTMLIGYDTGLLLVGSGNLTYNGHSLNEEIWSVFSTAKDDNRYLHLFKKAWEYLYATPAVMPILLEQQFKWMTDNAAWLQKAQAQEDASATVEDEIFHFIANGPSENLLSKLERIIGKRDVRSIEIVSPFYDLDGRILEVIENRFKPSSINCIISPSGTYPVSKIQDSDNTVSFYRWHDVFEQSSITRILHAKLIQFNLQNATVLVVGSANATSAALLGANDEACIVIESKTKRDYLDHLGIRYADSFKITNKTIDSLPAPSQDKKAGHSFQFHIFAAEFIDNTLRITTNAINTDLHIGLISLAGKLSTYDGAINHDGLLTVKPDNMDEACIVVLLDRGNNMEISNRCFIITEEKTRYYNPNRKLRQLESLLDSSVNWKSDLMSILSFIVFEEDDTDLPQSVQQLNPKSKNETNGKVISKEEFDNIHCHGKHYIATLPDVRILDFLIRENNGPVENELSDDSDSITDVDTWSAGYQSRSLKEKTETNGFHESVVRYGKYLARHYENLLKEFNKELGKFSIITSFPKDKTKTISVRDYSHILINIVLIWKDIVQDPSARHITYKQDLLSNIGAFLLLSWPGYEQKDTYEWHKTVEFHKNLTIFSLLTIAHFKWTRSEAIAAKVVILNILDSWRKSTSTTAEMIRTLFLQECDKFKGLINDNSLNLILATMKQYEIFDIMRNEDKSRIVRPVMNFESGEYLYKQNCGFIYGYDFQYCRDNAGHPTYRYMLKHPGLTKDLITQSGLILAL